MCAEHNLPCLYSVQALSPLKPPKTITGMLVSAYGDTTCDNQQIVVPRSTAQVAAAVKYYYSMQPVSLGGPAVTGGTPVKIRVISRARGFNASDGFRWGAILPQLSYVTLAVWCLVLHTEAYRAWTIQSHNGIPTQCNHCSAMKAAGSRQHGINSVGSSRKLAGTVSMQQLQNLRHLTAFHIAESSTAPLSFSGRWGSMRGLALHAHEAHSPAWELCRCSCTTCARC
jgi:hypothetical protein